MRPGFFILAALLPLQAGQSSSNAQLDRALSAIAGAASTFWHAAPAYIARETLHQKALSRPKRRLHIGAGAAEPPKPAFEHREIISLYAFSSFRTAPEALHEFREIVSVDGQAMNRAPGKLREAIDKQDDAAKKGLLAAFEKSSLAVAATDFGQIILLFTKASLGKYTFESHGFAFSGADLALVVAFRQSAGGESLRVTESGKEAREPLAGEIWIRDSDGVPLRITLNSSRARARQNCSRRSPRRLPTENGWIDSSRFHGPRRFVDEGLQVENIYQYADWQPIPRR